MTTASSIFSVASSLARRRPLKSSLLRLHRSLAWLGFVAMVLWGVSGLLHPWLTTFGAQQAVFSPPLRVLDLDQAMPLEAILQDAGIEKAQVIKVIVGETANLLQVTEAQQVAPRYFDLNSGMELQGYDPVYAGYLARHYMNLPDTPLIGVERVDRFSEAYPAVNRLLPVYHVKFDRPDGLNAYVYTETGVLAGVSDNTKQRVQTAFQWLHTWSCMPKVAETPRVLVVGALVGVLFVMAASGLAMLLIIRRKTRAAGAKGWHRIAGYALVLPVMMFSFSGFYHVAQHGWPTENTQLNMRPAMDVKGLAFPLNLHWQQITENVPVTGFSITMNQQNHLLYRFALPAPRVNLPQGEQAIRSARFDGVQPTGPALYIDAGTGQPWKGGDREMAFQLAELHTGLPRIAVKSASLVTRFGGDYDFRNKRLPVWKFDYNEPLNASVFIDTATGILADQTPHIAKPEIWSFSMLHKWGFLGGLGRNAQNIIMSLVVILAIILMAGFGLRSRYS